jgi:hypothetical protein
VLKPSIYQVHHHFHGLYWIDLLLPVSRESKSRTTYTRHFIGFRSRQIDNRTINDGSFAEVPIKIIDDTARRRQRDIGLWKDAEDHEVQVIAVLVRELELERITDRSLSARARLRSSHPTEQPDVMRTRDLERRDPFLRAELVAQVLENPGELQPIL